MWGVPEPEPLPSPAFVSLVPRVQHVDGPLETELVLRDWRWSAGMHRIGGESIRFPAPSQGGETGHGLGLEGRRKADARQRRAANPHQGSLCRARSSRRRLVHATLGAYWPGLFRTKVSKMVIASSCAFRASSSRFSALCITPRLFSVVATYGRYASERAARSEVHHVYKSAADNRLATDDWALFVRTTTSGAVDVSDPQTVEVYDPLVPEK